jgi:hypothetical protein
MGLEALIDRLEARLGTAGTAAVAHAVPPKPAPALACTACTAGTSQKTERHADCDLGAAGTAGTAGTSRNLAAQIEALPPDQREAFEERAAIMEHDAGMPRAEAERLALLDVTQQGAPR